MQPQILVSGVTGSRVNYEAAIQAAGGVPHSFYCPKVDTGYDGLLLCGGGDVDPTFFGQKNNGSTEIDLKRDRAELALCEAYIAARKPVFGICRGHQVINIAQGGTLIQDISPELHLFHSVDKDEREDKLHWVCAAAGSLFHRLYGPLFVVNSSHHQAILRPGLSLRPGLWSESGIVEAMEHYDLPVFSVQFHPERMAYAKRRSDTVDGALLFEYFIGLCGGASHAK